MLRQANWLVWCVLIAGCAGTQFGSLKRTGAPVDLTAPPTSARLILVRQYMSFADGSTPFLIERHAMRPFAEVPAGTVVTIDVAPGQYEFCLVDPQIRQTGWRHPNWYFDLSTVFRTPLTRVEAAAGRTYLLEVRVTSGGMELVPARRDSLRLQRLEEWLPELQAHTPIADSPLLKPEPEEVMPWMENCIDSTPERWQMSGDDGR